MSYINIYTVHISYIRSFLFYIFSVSISVAPVVPVGDCNGFGFPKTFTSRVVNVVPAQHGTRNVC